MNRIASIDPNYYPPLEAAYVNHLRIGRRLLEFGVLAWLSLPYVTRSWAILERSREASGLPLVFLLKTLIPLFALLLGLQGLAQAARAWLTLAGGAPSDPGH